jgi:uncharacterized phage-associated protein
MYRSLANALAGYGRDEVTRAILESEAFDDSANPVRNEPARSDLDQSETDLISEIYQDYGDFESWQLSALTRKGDTPWKQIFADGSGRFRDIPHELIRAQFVKLLRQSEETREDR